MPPSTWSTTSPNAPNDPEISHLVDTGDHEALDAWLYGRDVLDVPNVDPNLTITPRGPIAELKPLAARVYSISSSPRVHSGSVHITMATVRYRTGNRDRGGVCSIYLADRRSVASRWAYITPTSRSGCPPMTPGHHDRVWYRRRAVPRLPA